MRDRTIRPKSRKSRIFAGLFLICVASAAFFLLEGVDSAYLVFGGSGSSGVRGVSAFTYYFIWPQSKHNAADKKYDLASLLGNLVGDTPTATLSQRMAQNGRIATALGVTAIILGILSFGFRRPPD